MCECVQVCVWLMQQRIGSGVWYILNRVSVVTSWCGIIREALSLFLSFTLSISVMPCLRVCDVRRSIIMRDEKYTSSRCRDIDVLGFIKDERTTRDCDEKRLNISGARVLLTRTTSKRWQSAGLDAVCQLSSNLCIWFRSSLSFLSSILSFLCSLLLSKFTHALDNIVSFKAQIFSSHFIIQHYFKDNYTARVHALHLFSRGNVCASPRRRCIQKK